MIVLLFRLLVRVLVLVVEGVFAGGGGGWRDTSCRILAPAWVWLVGFVSE